MAIADDVEFDLTNKIMQRTSGAGATKYSANAVYSFAMDTFDELTHMDDPVPMSAQTPISYTMINGWYVQEDLILYIQGGAIQSSGYNDEIRTLICGSPGWTNFVAGDIGNTIIGSVTGDTGSILDYDNVAYKIWVRMDAVGDLFDNATENYTQSGTGAATATAISNTGETIFANPYSLGTLIGTPQLYIFQGGNKLANSGWFGTGHFDILIKVTESGVDIDSKKITVFCRNWTDLYDHYEITLTTSGQNAVPLSTSDDSGNQTAEGTVEDWQDGTISTIAIAYSFAAPYSYDIGDGAGVQDYECQIDCDSQTLDKVYEVCKFWCRAGSTKQLETNADAQFVDGEEYDSADTGVYANVKQSPLGTFAGGKFFGARSIYFINLNAADAQNFELVDKAGNTRNPPNYQAFEVLGLVVGDRVTIYEDTGLGSGIVDKTQHTSHAANNAAGDSTFETQAAITTDTPTSGTLIVVATGELEEHVYRYASYSGVAFTMPTAATGAGTAGSSTTQLTDSGATFQTADIEVGDIVYDSTNSEYAYVVSIDSQTQMTMTAKTTSWNGANYETNSLVQTYDGADTAYVPYIYETATGTSANETTTIYTGDKYVLCRVRIKGIIPYETTGTYGSTGYTATASRVPDSIVT